jgi:predicted HTH domain antitoxin
VKWYELGRISQAKAAEMSGLSRAAFLDALRAYRVPAIQVDPDELERELAL